MTNVTTGLPGADNYVLQAAITAYSDEAYTNARKLSGTAIAGTDARIDASTETFIGQMRWFKPLNPAINIASLTDRSEGVATTYASEFATYVKSARTHGAEKVNMQHIVTQQDGLAKIGRDFAETRAQDEHDAMLSVMKGVAISEALNGGANGAGGAGLGGQTFDNDPTNKRYGFYVDLGNNAPVVEASTTRQGASRAEGFLNALGMAYKDYEPEYAYLICSPQTISSLRSANLVDQTKVSEANVTFETIFGGKFRLIQTRATQGFSAAQMTKLNTGGGVDIVGSKVSYIVLPGAIAMHNLNVEMPTEITRDGAAFKGGGSTNIWHRWGYIAHPAGYNWEGSQEQFASNDDYQGVIAAGNPSPLLGAAALDGTVRGTWGRKANSALSLRILPVFHG